MTINTILVVEDDQFLSKIIKQKFENMGQSVLLAYDGAEAMRVLDEQTPDLVLLDIMMPIKNGLSVLADMKKSPKLNKIPVIVVSNLGQKDDKEKAEKLGASDYFVKSDTSLDDIVKAAVKIVKQK